MDYLAIIKFIFGTIGFLIGLGLLVYGIWKKSKSQRWKGVYFIIGTFAILLITLGIEVVLS